MNFNVSSPVEKKFTLNRREKFTYSICEMKSLKKNIKISLKNKQTNKQKINK